MAGQGKAPKIRLLPEPSRRIRWITRGRSGSSAAGIAGSSQSPVEWARCLCLYAFMPLGTWVLGYTGTNNVGRKALPTRLSPIATPEALLKNY